MNTNKNYVGLTREEALEKAKKEKKKCRIRSIDGKGTIGTADLDLDRLNFHLENNIVKEVTKG